MLGLNYIINSLLCFLTLLPFCFFIHKLFRIHHPRLLTYLYSIPILKLFIDPFLYNYQGWALFHEINPILAEEGTRTITLSLGTPLYIGFTVHNDFGYSLADMIALQSPFWLVQTLVVAIFSISILRFFFKQTKPSYSRTPFEGTIECESLAREMEEQKISLYTSPNIPSPFTTGKKEVVIPSSGFTQQEIEAVIAHELEHQKYYDPHLLYLYRFAETFFWWIPIKYLRRKIEAHIEAHADQAVYQYKLNPIDLASAIVKSGKTQWDPKYGASLSSTGTIQNRVERLLAKKQSKKMGWIQISLLTVASTWLLFGRLWLF